LNDNNSHKLEFIIKLEINEEILPWWYFKEIS